jgi:hypothetical protein
MKPASDNTALTVPASLLAELKEAADEEHRPVADVLRDAVQRYLSESHRDARPAIRRTPAEAAARMREHRKGTFLPEGVTIRNLTDYGRA